MSKQKKSGATQAAPTEATKSAAANNTPLASPERERPVITALALAFVPGQGWTSIIYKIQGDKVIQVQASEPDLKLIAQEKFKVHCGKVIISEAGSIDIK